MNDVDYYDDNDDDNDDVRLNDVDDVDDVGDVVFPFYFFFYFISAGMEWRGGGKVQDLILSIYIHRHTELRQKMKSFPCYLVVFPRIDRTRQLALFFFFIFISSFGRERIKRRAKS